jgi:hypothetical protein
MNADNPPAEAPIATTGGMLLTCLTSFIGTGGFSISPIYISPSNSFYIKAYREQKSVYSKKSAQPALFD